MDQLNSSGSGGFSDVRPALYFLLFAAGLTIGIVLCAYQTLHDSSKPNQGDAQHVESTQVTH